MVKGLKPQGNSLFLSHKLWNFDFYLISPLQNFYLAPWVGYGCSLLSNTFSQQPVKLTAMHHRLRMGSNILREARKRINSKSSHLNFVIFKNIYTPPNHQRGTVKGHISQELLPLFTYRTLEVWSLADISSPYILFPITSIEGVWIFSGTTNSHNGLRWGAPRRHDRLIAVNSSIRYIRTPFSCWWN